MGIVRIEVTPSSKMATDITTKVYGRRRANRTIHIHSSSYMVIKEMVSRLLKLLALWSYEVAAAGVSDSFRVSYLELDELRFAGSQGNVKPGPSFQA
jgi:hypothetical protein